MALRNPSETDWEIIIDQIQDKRFTPIISGRVMEEFLPKRGRMLHDWARKIEYPTDRESSLTDLIRYHGLEQTEKGAITSYIRFAKNHLVRATPAAERPEAPINVRNHTLTEIASLLKQPRFAALEDNPIKLLAKLNLPIYITTSHYEFLEEALIAEGKKPESEVCPWQSGPKKVIDTGKLRVLLDSRIREEDLRNFCFDLDIDFENLPGDTKSGKLRELLGQLEQKKQVPRLIRLIRRDRPDLTDDLPDIGQLSIFERERSYEPTPQRPLVYHMFGIETNPDSLVLTEDHFLDFLIKVSWDDTLIPVPLRRALADTSLLLLGYHLDDWEFKILFRGLITSKRASRRPLSIAIQLEQEEQPDDARLQYAEIQKYLQRYFFDRARFKIYWGDPQAIMKELWQQVEMIL